MQQAEKQFPLSDVDLSAGQQQAVDAVLTAFNDKIVGPSDQQRKELMVIPALMSDAVFTITGLGCGALCPLT